MITSEKPHAKKNSIGFYVRFRRNNQRFYRLSKRTIGLYRYALEIGLPDVPSDDLIIGLVRAIDNIQDGACWPLRIEWDNAQGFFSLEQLARLDALLIDVPIYIYGVPATISKESERLYKLAHAKYMQKKRAGLV